MMEGNQYEGGIMYLNGSEKLLSKGKKKFSIHCTLTKCLLDPR